MGGQGAQAGSIAYTENYSPTLRATESGSNQVPDVVYGIEGHVIDRNTAQNGRGWSEGFAHTLNATDRHGVAYTIDGRNGVLNTEKSGTLQAKTNGGFSYNFVNPLVYPQKPGALCANSHPGSYTGQDAYNDMLPVYPSEKPYRKWIVRRLTPVECARLQGFPDHWGVPEHKDRMTQEETAFWEYVRKTHCLITGKTYKPMKTMERLVRWYNNLHTDSAEYKMWGNGIALPCAAYVMGRIAEEVQDAT
jgi:DNA (cytosine-5)-methyltransferase 1